MNRLSNRRWTTPLTVASLLALAGGFGCAADGPSNTENHQTTLDIQLGDTFVRADVGVEVSRLKRDVASTRDYGETLAALEEAGALDGDGAPFSGHAAGPSSFSVTPVEGQYSLRRSFINRDGCGFDGSDGQALSEFVVDFLEVEQQYVRLFTGTESNDVLGDICVLDGRLYTCYKEDQVVDFAFAGLDAEVSIRTDEQGIWSLDSRYVALTRQVVSCEGSQCDQEPASSLLELIEQPMPCSTLGISARAHDAEAAE